MSEEIKELENVPFCSCGKCIVKRLRKSHNTNFPYNKSISSTYGTDFDAKPMGGSPNFYNRSKHSGFEGSYREHLPTGLMSTMKFDFKPFRVKIEDKPQEEVKIVSVPFNGRSSYQTAYPNWGALSANKEAGSELPEIKVPFRGNSNYAENYLKHSAEFYKKREMTKNHPTLGFYGKFMAESSNNSSYKPIDFNQPHYFNKERITKTKVEGKSSLVPAEFPKSNFESLYGSSYIDYRDKRCQLAEYLKTKGLKSLEI